MTKSRNNRKGAANDGGPTILIIVVGPVGSGKTRFINTLLQEQRMSVTEGLADGTTNIQVTDIPSDLVKGYPSVTGRRLLIADTPGLDGINGSRTTMQIADWLKKSHINIVFVGFIYLHDISNDRSSNTALQDFRFLQKYCGCKIGEVIIGTTKWQRINPEVGLNRVKQLSDGDKYWKPLVTKGSMVRKFEDTHDSAWGFVDIVLKKAIVIPVMGATGAGKSSFINKLLENDVVKVGHTIKSCTQEVQTVFIDDLPSFGYEHLAHYRLVIVDTPGFDDTDKPETVIFSKIADWLEKSYRQKEIMTGVIYLHNISNNRFAGSAQRNLKVFHRICGDDALKKVVLGTTMWDPPITQILEDREEDLKREYWRPLIDKGSKVERFHYTKESAWKIVGSLLDSFAARSLAGELESVLQIQKELVDDHKPILQTEAGKQVLENLKNIIARQEDRLHNTSGGKGAELERDLSDLNDLKKHLRKLTLDSKISFPPKLRRFLGL